MKMLCTQGFVVESHKTKLAFKWREMGTGFESQVKFRVKDFAVKLHAKSKFSHSF